MEDNFNNSNNIELYSDSGYSKDANGDQRKHVVWHDNDGMHTETTVIHKNVPSIGTILLTALVFTAIGALIASLIFFARFMNIKSLAKEIYGHSETVTEAPYATAAPHETEKPTPQPYQPGQPGQPQQPFQGAENPIPEIYSKSVTGVVIVSSYKGSIRTSNLIGTGTGFCISNNGYVMTNAHVVEGASSFQLTTYNNKAVTAKLIGADVRTDIAVLKIDDPSILAVLELGDSSTVRTGDFVFAIGHPTGDELSFTATFGMVGAVERSVIIDGVRNEYIQIDAAINPGNSGGPLFDMNGRVIGVNSAKTVIASYDDNGDPISAEGLGFALPINIAVETANTIISEGGIQRPGIGISTIFINTDTAAKYSIPQGALVYTITEDGPGHHAGLKIDDIITAADNQLITDGEFLGKYIRSKNVGDTVILTVWRDGTELRINIEIGDLNSIGSTILNNEYGGEKYGLR